MERGSYNNYSRTPVAYSLYDRYSIGFANAQVINAKGEYTLNQIDATGEGYIINSPESQVKFYLENRQNTCWDAYAPSTPTASKSIAEAGLKVIDEILSISQCAHDLAPLLYYIWCRGGFVRLRRLSSLCL